MIMSFALSTLSFDQLATFKRTMSASEQSALLATAVGTPALEPFEFPSGRHPLAAVALTIEKIKSGRLSLFDARATLIQLDEVSRRLFQDTELTLIDNPSPLVLLGGLVEEMLQGNRSMDKGAVLSAFNLLGPPLRNALAGRIYEFSKDPLKGNCDRWGEIHASDDLICLKSAIFALKDALFESTWRKVEQYAHGRLSSLARERQIRVFGEIYRIERPVTTDPDWGENNATANLPRLITALHLCGEIEGGPKAVGRYDRSWESYTNQPSRIFDCPGKKLRQGEISFINGMGAHSQDVINGSERFRDLFLEGYASRCVYASTYGDRDLLSCLYGQQHIALPQSRMLVQNWGEFFAHSDPEENFLQLCTSRGAIDVESALHQLPDYLRRRIYVIAIAPGYIIENTSCRGAFNFVIPQDLVPTLAPNAHLLGEGRPEVIVLEPHRTGEDPHNAFGSSYVEAIKPLVAGFVRSNTMDAPSFVRTGITVRFQTGPNEKLFIRGSGPYMSWNQGIALQKSGMDLWSFETRGNFQNFEYKILLDDLRWEQGSNHTAECGRREEIVPQFNRESQSSI